MAQSYWREVAAKVIHQAIKDATTQNLDRQQTIKLIDSRYPFGPRSHHPYKMWLDVRREALARWPMPNESKEVPS